MPARTLGPKERWIVRWYQSPTLDDDDVPTQVNIGFHRMERRRENLPIEFLDCTLKKYARMETKIVEMQIEHEKQMMQMQADAFQNQIQILVNWIMGSHFCGG